MKLLSIKKKQRNSQSGFTILELVLYIAIVSSILVVISEFAFYSLAGNIKSRAVQEVQQNLRFTLNRIAYEVRNGEDINEAGSTLGSSLGVLHINGDIDANDKIFNLSSTALMIQEGDPGTPVAMSTDEVEVTNLTFERFPDTGMIRDVKISITAQYIDPSNRQETTLTTSANLRQ